MIIKLVNILTLILVIVGGLNWGLVGLFSIDLVAAIFGTGSTLARIVYALVAIGCMADHPPVFCNGLRRVRC